jgi:hypothetical protein
MIMARHGFLWAFILLPLAAWAVAAPADRAAAAEVLATAEYSDDPGLKAEILEVKRVSGGALLIRWRIVNGEGGAGGLTADEGKSIKYDFGWDELFVIDPAENKKYGFLVDTEGNRILDVYYGTLEAGQQRANWAKFPAPPASSGKISITIPGFPPFEDVPVSG